MIFVILVIVWFALLGPKLAGVIDLSLGAGLFGYLLLARTKSIRISQEYVVVVTLAALVLAYSICAVVIDGAEDIQPVLRHLRSVLSTVLLGVFFYNIGYSCAISAGELTKVLVVVLLTNAMVVLVSVLEPSIQTALAGLYGFDKGVRPLRSFGLTAGYDTAGYLCVIGAVMASISLYYRKTKAGLVSLVLFGTAALFTSRSSMLLIFGLVAGFCMFYLIKGRWTLKVVSAVCLGAGGYIAAIYVIPLVAATFGWGALASDNAAYSQSFAATDLAAWVADMWTLPKKTLEVLFGTGAVVQTSDVGYIELVYMIGVVGSVLVYGIYGYLLFVAARVRSSAKLGDWTPDTETWVLLLTLQLVLLGLFVINIKNLYFLTRGFHELIVIIFFYVVGAWRSATAEITSSRTTSSSSVASA